jgi:hypothetical protein
LDTGRDDLTVAKRPIFIVGRHLGFADPLNTKGALFHHALGANRHLGIPGVLKRFMPNRVVEIEEPHGIRAIIRAIPRADTPVVYLGIQSFFGVICCEHRAHGLARGLVAVLAQDGHEASTDIGEFALEITFHPDPVDRAALRCLGITGDANVVLGMTCHYASLAPGAEIQVDYHSPSVCV